MKEAPSILLNLKRALIYVYMYKESIVAFRNFHQFEKDRWNKLVRAEIKARKYVLCQQRESPSNERQTELASPQLINSES